MSLNNTTETSFESPTKQLELFSSENNQYIESIKKTVDDFLNYDNKIFSNKDTELYLLEKNKEWNTVSALLICKLTGLNNQESFFQLNVTIDKLKKYIYVDHKWTKWMEWIKINMAFMWENNLKILPYILDWEDQENYHNYHIVVTKPRDIKEKEVQKNPELHFSDTKFEIDGDLTHIYFTINNSKFRVLNIKTSTNNSNNWNNDNNSTITEFNKFCLNNIWIIPKWWKDFKWFTWAFNYY